MKQRFAVLVSAVLLGSVLLGGCTALQQIAALRSVAFAFGEVSDVRCAGIRIGPETRFSNLGLADLARVTGAIAKNRLPLELVVHVNATNPPGNRVAARMVEFGWRFFVNDAEALAGRAGQPVVIEPGATADVPVAVSLDLLKMKSGTARDLFDLAVAIGGHGPVHQDLKLELTPTIDTALGPIAYPSPIVIRRAASTN